MRKQSGSIPHVGTFVALLLCGFWFLGWFWCLFLLLWFVAFGLLLFSASPVSVFVRFWSFELATSYKPVPPADIQLYKRQKKYIIKVNYDPPRF